MNKYVFKVPEPSFSYPPLCGGNDKFLLEVPENYLIFYIIKQYFYKFFYIYI